jgi:hypothetical protein
MFFSIGQDFGRWNVQMISDWFASIGLGNYCPALQRWQPNGAQLQAANAAQLERDLQMRNPLHRKKLGLALKCIVGQSDNLTQLAFRLDYLWVARWLDDLGLPQYKEQFLEARVDGAVLHHLTVEELLSLRVQTQLHHDSIRCGIQVLRSHNFAPNRMCRRAEQVNEEESNHLSSLGSSYDGSLSASNRLNNVSTDQLCVWSSHRVMEWLRSIDLSEFVANLRGSGVHGGLIILHDAFGSDLLATLLSIAPSKTLLRRHISTHFRSLIGPELSHRKRQFECEAEHLQQLAFAKVKVSARSFKFFILFLFNILYYVWMQFHRKSNFSFRRKKSDNVGEEYVCPLNFQSSVLDIDKKYFKEESSQIDNDFCHSGSNSLCLPASESAI